MHSSAIHIWLVVVVGLIFPGSLALNPFETEHSLDKKKKETDFIIQARE